MASKDVNKISDDFNLEVDNFIGTLTIPTEQAVAKGIKSVGLYVSSLGDTPSVAELIIGIQGSINSSGMYAELAEIINSGFLGIYFWDSLFVKLKRPGCS